MLKALFLVEFGFFKSARTQRLDFYLTIFQDLHVGLTWAKAVCTACGHKLWELTAWHWKKLSYIEAVEILGHKKGKKSEGRESKKKNFQDISYGDAVSTV